MDPGHAALLELSDERDQWEQITATAYREGWRAAEQEHVGDYAAGYHDGLLGRKRFEHQLVEEAELELLRWGPGGPGHFGDPQPGDWPGGPAGLDKVRQAWLGQGLDLGPGPGWVHLGGRRTSLAPPVHESVRVLQARLVPRSRTRSRSSRRCPASTPGP